MDLSRLLSLTRELPVYKQLKDALSVVQTGSIKLAAAEAVRPFLIAALHSDLKVPIVVVTAQPGNARRLHEELLVWSPGSESLHFFPEIESLTEGPSSDIRSKTDRIKVFSSL